MYLLVATLLTGKALAFPEITITLGHCGTRPPPCLGLATGDASIVPSDWYERVSSNLDGDFNWFRIEVPLTLGAFDVEVAGVYLDGRSQSFAESSEKYAVYYVPAERDATVTISAYGERYDMDFGITMDGATKAPF
jgi:hypothetical protein